MTFPPTKFRPGEGLYSALVRPMEEDLGLQALSYYPENELGMIPNEGESPRYPGLTKQWYLYPVDISLTPEAAAFLKVDGKRLAWWTIEEILDNAKEPNVRAIAQYIKNNYPMLLQEIHHNPSMDALASHWAARNKGGVRHVKAADIRNITDAGNRAFNLRVADPYLPYQKQGLGFTWSFFTPKDTQDVHVHGLPAVEIYGVIEGRLQVWHKPMTERGVRTWHCVTLEPGDWLEVEPLHCHFAFWLEPQGLGTVLKAAGSGELAGVGKIGVAGKTTCKDCNVQKQCVKHPMMLPIIDEYAKPFEQRNYKKISALASEIQFP
jgi:mannose-6-phosphate isomerase-like protein (cupin superfamily)